MNISTKGAFGRPARYRYGPMPVVRTAHPASLEFLQLPSTEHKHNLLQYFVCPTVRSVKVDQQLPTWLPAFVPKRAAPFTQVVEFLDGSMLIVRLRRAWDDQPSVVSQLKPRIWYTERTTLDVALPATLNRNLELLCQAHITHYSVVLHEECAALTQALQAVASTTVGDLKSYARVRLGLAPEIVVVVLARLLLARKLSLQLASTALRDATVVRWGETGVGYTPPMPPWTEVMREEEAA